MKLAITGGVVFIIQWAILAGISVAHDYGAFESWYRSVFRHPRLIALVCGLVAAIVLLLLHKPRKFGEVITFSAPILICNLVGSGIVNLVSYDKKTFYSDLGFWAGRLLFIFNYAVVVVVLVAAVVMFAAKSKERRIAILTGALCAGFTWMLLYLVGRIADILFPIFDAFPDGTISREVIFNIAIVGILFLIPFLILKFSKLMKSYKQLALFAVSAFAASSIIFETIDSIQWWDGADKGLGIVFAAMYITCAMVLICAGLAIDLLIQNRKNAPGKIEVNS